MIISYMVQYLEPSTQTSDIMHVNIIVLGNFIVNWIKTEFNNEEMHSFANKSW